MTPMTMDEFDHLDVFERERILNKLAFALMGRIRIMDKAGLDRRLGYGHRYIIYSLARAADIADGGVAELDRDAICADLGITKKTLRNKLADLYAWGYIHQKFLPSGGVSDTVAFGNAAVQREELQAQYVSAISEFCAAKRSELSRDVGQPSRDVGTVVGDTVPGCRATVPGCRATVPESGDGAGGAAKEKSPHTPLKENNNIYTPLTPQGTVSPPAEQASAKGPAAPDETKAQRGTRLPTHWRLPKSWGEWALENFDVTPAQVRKAADEFADYWHSATGAKARKIEWVMVWRNWCRHDARRWRMKTNVKSTAAPDLLDIAAAKPKAMSEAEKLLAYEREMFGGDA